MSGILVSIVDEVLANRLHLNVEHAGYPWARAQAMVEHGQADAFVTVPTAERRAYTVPSAEWVTQGRLTMFSRADNPKLAQWRKIQRISELSEVPLGTYLGNNWVKSKFEGMNVQYANDRAGALRMLMLGRFDLMVDASNPTRHAIKAEGLEHEVVELPATLDVSETRLCVGKKSPLLARMPDIDRALRSMKKDGTLARLSGFV